MGCLLKLIAVFPITTNIVVNIKIILVHVFDQVNQLTWRVSRKKASVEAMLKTAMQSQLDGVRTGLNLLERALTDISEIKNNMNEMESALGGVPQYYEQLRDVREENLRKEFN